MKLVLASFYRALMQVPPLFYLGVAVLIFGASNSITRKIIELGRQHLVEGRNPISLCNVLFIGNICALLLMVALFHRDWNPRTLRQITRKDWLALTAIGVLSGALVPALIFAALGQTTVGSVVLIGRIEPPLTLILGFVWLRSRVNGWTAAGSVFAFAGVAVIVGLGNPGQPAVMMGLGRGEIYVAIAAVISSAANITTKLTLKSIPIGIFSIYRNIIGTIVFFFLAVALYGSQHFVDAFSPFLWVWMLIYAGLIVVLGQWCQLTGIRKATSAEISLTSACSPVVAIAMAYAILGEIPSQAQYKGGIIIGLGIILSFIGSLRQNRAIPRLEPLSPPKMMGMETGFKGL